MGFSGFMGLSNLWMFEEAKEYWDVSMYVPGFWIPKPIDFSHSLGDHLSKNLVECLSALRTRIVIEKT